MERGNDDRQGAAPTTRRRLQVARETLRGLGQSMLQQAAGGLEYQTNEFNTCDTSGYWGCSYTCSQEPYCYTTPASQNTQCGYTYTQCRETIEACTVSGNPGC